MTLYRRGKTWWVEYQADGLRHRVSTKTRDFKEAKAWAAHIEVARRMPTFEDAVAVLRTFYKEPAAGVMPIDEMWANYERVAKATGRDAISESSTRMRRNIMSNFVSWIKSDCANVRTAEQVTGPVAAAYAAHINDGKRKSKTRINIITNLSTVFKMLGKANANVTNPWTNLAPIDTDSTRGEAFTHEQEAAVLAACDKIGKDWRPVCDIMRLTGLRYGDVATLEWEDVNGDAIRLEPRKNATHNARSRRKITVAIPMTDALRAVFVGLVKRGPFVFPMHAHFYGNRGRMSRDALAFREVLDAAKIKGRGYSIHSWRHTAATRLAESGVDIETRKRILGHTEDVTARRYDHDEHLEEVRAAMEKMEKTPDV